MQARFGSACCSRTRLALVFLGVVMKRGDVSSACAAVGLGQGKRKLKYTPDVLSWISRVILLSCVT